MHDQHTQKDQHSRPHASECGQPWQTKLLEICQKSLHWPFRPVKAKPPKTLPGNSTLPTNMRVTFNAAITEEHCDGERLTPT
ncbi:hypothetical protein GCM10010937_15200 [Gluconobacter japonicus]|uniref:Transposase n=1 Tax=Gluconobacter japonicus TaxID=376620 RepID=A0ABQ5WHP6_GLUJA|nr:hypothetical protein AA3271_2422 [Gluconobacter japonicus NBRC 3271]GLQ59717.1 hypothetical protein GCM10010937_15200 [Gluconobacter japonicus]